MFVITDKNEQVYNVLDTSDNIVESVSKDNLLEYINNGITILGVTEYSLSIDKLAKVIFRFRLSKTELKYYDGYSFYDSIEEVNPYLYQLVDVATDLAEDLSDVYAFMKVFEYIRKIAYEDFKNFSVTNCKIGYKLVGVDDKLYITVRDLETNNLYKFNFADIAYCLYNEEKVIDGVDYTYSSISFKCWSSYIDLVNLLVEYLALSRKFSNCDLGIKSTNVLEYIDSFSASFSDIDMKLGDSDFVLSSFCGVPLYSIYRNIVDCSENYDLIPFNRFKGKCELKGDKIYTDSEVIDFNDFVYYARALSVRFPEVYSQVLKLIEAKRGKALLLNTSFKLDEYLKHSLYIGYNVYVKMPEFSDNLRYVNNYYIETPFGGIYMIGKTLVSDYSYDSIFSVRVSNCLTAWFSLKDWQLHYTTIKEESHNLLFNSCRKDTKKELMDGLFTKLMLKNKNIAYHGEIYPVGLESITVESDTIIINVACMVKDEKHIETEEWGAYGFGFFSIPLIFLGTEVKRYNNMFIIDMLCYRIILEENVFYNLSGTFDDTNIENVEMRCRGKKQLYMSKNNKTSLSASLKALNKNYIDISELNI